MNAQVKGAPLAQQGPNTPAISGLIGHGTTDDLFRRELEQYALTLEELAKVLRGVGRSGCAAIVDAQAKRARDALR